MTDIQVKSMEQNGLHLHLGATDKFKTISMMLMIHAPLEEETVTARALIPHILQGGTKHYPNRKKLKQKLEDMYGATLTSDVQKKGENQVITFRLDVAAEQFLSDNSTSLFEEALSLLHELLYQPVLEKGAFLSQIVDQEKRALKQRIASIYDDKMRYANVRITEEMFKHESYRLAPYGREKDLASLTPQSLYEAYETMMERDRFDLYIIGSFAEDDIKEKVREVFTASRQLSGEMIPTTASEHVKDVNVVHDAQKVKQGKLHLGYRTHSTFRDDDYEAARVGNALFGGFPSSKLFMNVREKESLAYYAASQIESHKGVLMVLSGIEFDKYERAVEIIQEQEQAMKNGDFTDEEVEQAKGMLLNQAFEAMDAPRGIVELSYHEIIANHKRSIQERIENIKKVTKEDVVRAVNKWELDTIYFLKGQGDEA
ncbi:insulinase family protein [Alkalihalobacillus sp. LMS6]|uniref:EF-P 5-aminopentanol modification-associated protein YfmF n=1 Tax=Bacillaceae TaxID=186817 RepID=UPI0020D0CC51|nr:MULTISPECIES: pitrilysin family protein [Bacillaceae]UTR04716.1 insulinase family protein [Alkalihalobacillus sp. LMS6]